jgi:uncharacterized protein YkwD
MKRVIIFAMLVCCVTAAPAVAASPKQTASAAGDMLREANRLRQQFGRAAHTQDATLQAQAQRWADYMARTGHFHHGGGEQVIAVGYRSGADAVRAWYWSHGHRAWLMSSTTRCGYAAARSPQGRWYFAGVYR